MPSEPPSTGASPPPATPAGELGPGTLLGRYRLHSQIGEGGMGKVFVADDEKLNRRVAVKILSLPRDADPEQLAMAKARMLREARAAAAFQNPHAVGVFDVGEQDDAPYIVMEWVDGENLRQRMRGPTIATADKLRWLREVASALKAAHTAGLVHRDIKPENVMIQSDGSAKVLDFGLTRRTQVAFDASAPTERSGLDTVTSDGTSLGTPAYMSPEQIRGTEVDGRTDQFAWGVMAFELLAGRHPFKGESALALAASILTDQPERLHDHWNEATEELASVIGRTLEKTPTARFDTMGDVLKGLGATLGAAGQAFVTPSQGVSQPVGVPTAVTAQTGESPTAQTPVAAGRSSATMFGGALLVAAIAIGGWQWFRQPAAPPLSAPSAIAVSAAPLPPSSASARSEALAGAAAEERAQVNRWPHRRKCREDSKHATMCQPDERAWCTDDEAFIVCCASGLAADPEGLCECPAGGTSVVSAQASGCKAAPKESSAPAIQRVIRANFGKFRECYEAALKRNPAMTGEIAITFDIDPKGLPLDPRVIRSKFPDTAFQRCIAAAFVNLRFEPPPEGGLSITYPLSFSPGK